MLIKFILCDVADKDKLNKSSMSFSTELILESLVLKYNKLNNSNTNFSSADKSCKNDIMTMMTNMNIIYI